MHVYTCASKPPWILQLTGENLWCPAFILHLHFSYMIDIDCSFFLSNFDLHCPALRPSEEKKKMYPTFATWEAWRRSIRGSEATT